MNETEPKVITLTQEEYDELVKQLEELAVQPTPKGDYQMIIFSRVFWDSFISKVFAALISIKLWVLFSVLYWPYDLVKKGHISGDNYAAIIIVVAPLVVGMREFAKMKSNKEAPTETTEQGKGVGQKLLDLVKQRFHI